MNDFERNALDALDYGTVDLQIAIEELCHLREEYFDDLPEVFYKSKELQDRNRHQYERIHDRLYIVTRFLSSIKDDLNAALRERNDGEGQSQ